MTSDDLSICETLADLAADAGFEAILGPSAADAEATTLAVFDGAVASAASIRDLGVKVGAKQET